MEIGISTWSVHHAFDAGKVDSLSFPSLCAEKFGVKLLEYVEPHLGPLEKDHLKEVSEAVKKAGCKVVCIAADNDFSTTVEEDRLKAVEHIKEILEIARVLGVPCIRVNPGWRSNDDAAEGRVIRALHDCIPAAKATGVKMALENHGGFSFNPDSVVRIMRAMDSEYIGTCPDWGNFARDDRYSALERIYPYALHSHAKSYDFDEKGMETKIDFPRVLEIIKRSGYNGVISIEFEGQGDEFDGVAKTKALLARLI